MSDFTAEWKGGGVNYSALAGALLDVVEDSRAAIGKLESRLMELLRQQELVESPKPPKTIVFTFEQVDRWAVTSADRRRFHGLTGDVSIMEYSLEFLASVGFSRECIADLLAQPEVESLPARDMEPGPRLPLFELRLNDVDVIHDPVVGRQFDGGPVDVEVIGHNVSFQLGSAGEVGLSRGFKLTVRSGADTIAVSFPARVGTEGKGAAGIPPSAVPDSP